MSDQDSASNNNVVDLSARRNSSINMEGYSLLPDLIWTPSPEMMKSQYGKVIFTNVRESYSATEDLLCTYTIMKEQEVRNDDRVAIFCVGWTRIDQVITWVPAALRPSAMEDLSVIFPDPEPADRQPLLPSLLPPQSRGAASTSGGLGCRHPIVTAARSSTGRSGGSAHGSRCSRHSS